MGSFYAGLLGSVRRITVESHAIDYMVNLTEIESGSLGKGNSETAASLLSLHMFFHRVTFSHLVFRWLSKSFRILLLEVG